MRKGGVEEKASGLGQEGVAGREGQFVLGQEVWGECPS